MSKKLTIEEFIERAKKVHGSKYDYSKTEYVNCDEKICIVCPKHGEFWQTPYHHLKGFGCQKCGFEKSREKTLLTTEEFIKKAKQVHGDEYDYSKTEYVGNKEKVCITCQKHGDFYQAPDNHLSQKCGCPKCGNEKVRLKHLTTLEEFITKARQVHGNYYDYSKVNFTKLKDKVTIICPIHGEFKKEGYGHLIGQGCNKCKGLRNKPTTEEFIARARKIHGDKYNYSKTEFKNGQTKVCISCPTHGEFWQKPYNHLYKKGCPLCKSSHLENEIDLFLKENYSGLYIHQKHFDWLGKQSLDFYIPKYNVAIECQGMQHFEPSKSEKSFFNLKNFKKIQENDIKKLQLCNENGVKILYYSNLGIVYPYKVFENKEELLKEIVTKNETSS